MVGEIVSLANVTIGQMRGRFSSLTLVFRATYPHTCQQGSLYCVALIRFMAHFLEMLQLVSVRDSYLTCHRDKGQGRRASCSCH